MTTDPTPDPTSEEPPAPYEELDHTALAAIYRNCVRVILRALYEKGQRQSYQSIIDRMIVCADAKNYGEPVITVDSLKSFCARTNQWRFNQNNRTLWSLHQYFRHNFHTFPGEVRAILLADWAAINGRSIATRHTDTLKAANALRSVETAFRAWACVGDDAMSRAIATLPGDYVMLRKSVLDPSKVIKSKVNIVWDQTLKLLKATHTHWDRQNWIRTSGGFAVPILNNSLALILQVEGGRALEYINVRLPMQARFRRLMGFASSIIFNGDPMSARVFLEREDDDWDQLGPRFDLTHPLLSDERRFALEHLLDHSDDQSGRARTVPDIAVDASSQWGGGRSQHQPSASQAPAEEA